MGQNKMNTKRKHFLATQHFYDWIGNAVSHQKIVASEFKSRTSYSWRVFFVLDSPDYCSRYSDCFIFFFPFFIIGRQFLNGCISHQFTSRYKMTHKPLLSNYQQMIYERHHSGFVRISTRLISHNNYIKMYGRLLWNDGTKPPSYRTRNMIYHNAPFNLSSH